MNMSDGRGQPVRLTLGWGRWLLGVVLAGLLGAPGSLVAQVNDGDLEVTFSRDVAPILQANCETCHRPGSMGPMVLQTYEEVRPWAPMIRDRVERRRMPPWHIEPGLGIQEFKNDISLTDDEIRTIAQWVDLGTPLGDPSDMPPPLVWDEDRAWHLESHFGRPPDLVLQSPKYTVPARGLDQWFEPVSYVEGIEEERWARAAEIRPGDLSSRYVFHHANSNLVGSAAGKDYDLYPTDSGRKITPGMPINWALHYFPIGEVMEDVYVEVAVWLYPPGEQPEFESSFYSFLTDPAARRQQLDQNSGCWEQPARYALDSPECHVYTRLADLVLAPHGTAVQQGVHVLDRPVRLNSLRGHMHMRGSYQTMEAIYPDGRREVINRINWDHKWHTAHEYEDHVAPLLPKGTVLIVTAQYDNTINNPNNPDPDQWVFFGRRAADEMGHFHMGVTWLEQEDYERLLAEREQLLQQVTLLGVAEGRE